MHNSLNLLNAELNPIYHLPALLGVATIVVVSRLRVNMSVVSDKTICVLLHYFANDYTQI